MVRKYKVKPPKLPKTYDPKTYEKYRKATILWQKKYQG